MDFFKRHYEKLLLLLMLVLLIGIMIYVVGVADQARSIKDSALKFEEADLRRNLAKARAASESEFNVALILETGKSDWKPSTQREIFDAKQGPVEGTFSDLVHAVRISACPHCKNLVPRYYFRNNVKCPACALVLADVPARPKERRRVITENDLDGDGMPNSYETSKGFNPNDPDDQLADADRDGFSNLFEYENDTDPKNPRSRMPLWYRLRYVAMESVILPIKFRSISTQNQLKDKSRWILQFSRPVMSRGRVLMDGDKPRETSYDHFIGQEIRIEDKTYKIVDAKYDVRQVGKDNYVDNSTVRIVQILPPGAKIKPDELTMQAEREVRSNDRRLIVEDVGTPASETPDKNGGNGRRRYIFRINQSIRIGNNITGYESYRLRDVDERSRTASFDRPNVTEGDATKDRNGKKILVTRDSEIPEDLQVKKTKAKTVGNSPYGSRRR